MILREMPATWNETFARSFYQRWGKESCIIGARTRHAEYPLYRQRLSIKAAWGGREDYFVDGRRLCVDDGTFLILNDGRSYASLIRSPRPVTSFSVFFKPGMAQEVCAALGRTPEALLDDPEVRGQGVEFSEHLRQHDCRVTPLLRSILRRVDAGAADPEWYEERLYALLCIMLDLHDGEARRLDSMAAVKAATRRELFRRAGLASDFINANFAVPLTLDAIARAACLSRFHCLRVFREAHGMTPAEFLTRRRVAAARRLLASGVHSVAEVAALVGFRSRSTLFRQLKRSAGVSASGLAGGAANDSAGDDEHAA